MSNRKVRCVIIRMPADPKNMDDIRREEIELNGNGSPLDSRVAWPGGEARGERPSMKDLLPWADPYILKLIDRCQKEVAANVAQKRDDWADRRGFLAHWDADRNEIEAEMEDGFREARAVFGEARDAFEGHPFGFEWEGEEVEDLEDPEFQPHEAYLRPVRKSK